MPQVFGCPHCQNPFQVPDDAAGQTVQCPSCATPVEVPELETAPEEQAEPEIFQCPHCEGQFGIDASMYGQQLACPHCENLVAIGDAPDETVPAPPIEVESKTQTVDETPDFEEEASDAGESSSDEVASFEPTADPEPSTEEDSSQTDATEQPEPDPEPEPEPVFEPKPVDHLLPPTFNVPDPVRFPARLGDEEVFLPDGKGGYQKVDANIVTITHNGEVYHLKRMTAAQKRRRSFIHNTIAIGIAVVLIYLTLRTIGLVS